MAQTDTHSPFPPPEHLWPEKVRPYARGWRTCINGRVLHVAGKQAKLRDVAAIAQAMRERASQTPREGLPTVLHVASDFFRHLDAQVKAGTIRERTAFNIKYECRRFIGHVGKDSIAAALSPSDFRQFRQSIDHHSPMTIASIMQRVGRMFRYAAKAELIPTVRLGPDWITPPREQVRGQRLGLEKCYEPDELLKLWTVADAEERLWIALGCVAGFIPTDLANMTADVYDSKTRIIDYRRWKFGRKRRVIPLPPELAEMLDAQIERMKDRGDGLLFVQRCGLPYNVSPTGKPTSAMTDRFNRAQARAGVYQKGRSLTGLRTTLYNWTPPGNDFERGIIMGRLPDTVDYSHYLEKVGTERLAAITSIYWAQLQRAISPVA